MIVFVVDLVSGLDWIGWLIPGLVCGFDWKRKKDGESHDWVSDHASDWICLFRLLQHHAWIGFESGLFASWSSGSHWLLEPWLPSSWHLRCIGVWDTHGNTNCYDIDEKPRLLFFFLASEFGICIRAVFFNIIVLPVHCYYVSWFSRFLLIREGWSWDDECE